MMSSIINSPLIPKKRYISQNKQINTIHMPKHIHNQLQEKRVILVLLKL